MLALEVKSAVAAAGSGRTEIVARAAARAAATAAARIVARVAAKAAVATPDRTEIARAAWPMELKTR